MLTFILGLVAGFAAPLVEGPIKRALDGILMAETPLEPGEMRGLSLAVCLLVAAVISAIFTNGGVIALTLGAVIGVFAPRLVSRFTGG